MKKERNINNNPSGKPYCCHLECDKDAIFEITIAGELEGNTHSCSEHVNSLIPQAGQHFITDLTDGQEVKCDFCKTTENLTDINNGYVEFACGACEDSRLGNKTGYCSEVCQQSGYCDESC